MVILIWAGCSATSQIQQDTTAPLAKPIDPIDAIIEAFNTYNIVALDEGNHNNILGHEFRLALLHDPRFPKVVNDIVVECGNSLYQEIMDRFTSGEKVTYDELKTVWEKTTQPPGVWNVPIYYEFFQAVRNLNATLPEDQKIRVLLGDPPVDPERQSKEDYIILLGQRDIYPAELIEREVIARSRRALVVYGGMHLLRKPPFFPASDPSIEKSLNYHGPSTFSIVEILENKGIKVFSIWWNTNDELVPLQPNITSWEIPSLTLVKNTVLGLSPFTTVYPYKINYTRINDKGQEVKGSTGADPDRSGLIQEQFNAIIVVDPPDSIKYNQ